MLHLMIAYQGLKYASYNHMESLRYLASNHEKKRDRINREFTIPIGFINESFQIRILQASLFTCENWRRTVAESPTGCPGESQSMLFVHTDV